MSFESGLKFGVRDQYVSHELFAKEYYSRECASPALPTGILCDPHECSSRDRIHTQRSIPGHRSNTLLIRTDSRPHDGIRMSGEAVDLDACFQVIDDNRGQIL